MSWWWTCCCNSGCQSCWLLTSCDGPPYTVKYTRADLSAYEGKVIEDQFATCWRVEEACPCGEPFVPGVNVVAVHDNCVACGDDKDDPLDPPLTVCGNCDSAKFSGSAEVVLANIDYTACEGCFRVYEDMRDSFCCDRRGAHCKKEWKIDPNGSYTVPLRSGHNNIGDESYCDYFYHQDEGLESTVWGAEFCASGDLCENNCVDTVCMSSCETYGPVGGHTYEGLSIFLRIIRGRILGFVMQGQQAGDVVSAVAFCGSAEINSGDCEATFSLLNNTGCFEHPQERPSSLTCQTGDTCGAIAGYLDLNPEERHPDPDFGPYIRGGVAIGGTMTITWN